MGRLDRVPAGDQTFAEFLRQACGDQPPGAVAMARAFVEGLDAADAEVVSARSIKASEDDGRTFDADTSFRLFDGYDRLIEAVARPLRVGAVRLNTAVRSVAWSRGRVTVETTAGERLRADRAIVTLPIGVLRTAAGAAGAVRFDPPLPPAMRRAVDQLRTGPVVKVLLRFDRPFWEDGPWRNLAFLHALGGPVPTWWTTRPCRTPILTGWAGGPAAAPPLSHRRAADVIDVALGVLGPLLGVDGTEVRDRLAGWHVADWQADPFAGGRTHARPSAGPGRPRCWPSRRTARSSWPARQRTWGMPARSTPPSPAATGRRGRSGGGKSAPGGGGTGDHGLPVGAPPLGGGARTSRPLTTEPCPP